jgi:hypothetical protein
MNKTYIKTANLVLGYLELRFINLHKEAEIAEKERALWASELESKIEPERITQQNIVKACDLWADINTNGYPPTVDQFMGCLRKVSYVVRVALPVSDDEVDYWVLWNGADDKGKFRFFIDHPFNKVAPYIRLIFIEYMKTHHGWSHRECNKMINYHAAPFAGAEMGAYITNQREIIDYFVNRKVA